MTGGNSGPKKGRVWVHNPCCMTTGDSDTPIQINPAWLKPFASFLVIECTSSTPKEAMAQLQTFIGTAITRKRGEAVVVATGVDAPADVLREDGDGYGFDEIDGALFRAEAPPSWGTVDAPYKESRYGVLLLLRRGRLLAIHGDDGLREAILRWVESDRQPPFRKIAPAIMQGAFLRGKARGLWLRGTHARRSTKA